MGKIHTKGQDGFSSRYAYILYFGGARNILMNRIEMHWSAIILRTELMPKQQRPSEGSQLCTNLIYYELFSLQ